MRVQGMKKALDCGSMQCKAKGCFWGFEERIMPRPGTNESVTFRINGGVSGQEQKETPAIRPGLFQLRKERGYFYGSDYTTRLCSNYGMWLKKTLKFLRNTDCILHGWHTHGPVKNRRGQK